MDPRDCSEVDKAFSCPEDFAILEVGLPYVDALAAALCWLDDIFVLLVGHDWQVEKKFNEAIMKDDQFEALVMELYIRCSGTSQIRPTHVL
jgi:hypothetical protein